MATFRVKERGVHGETIGGFSVDVSISADGFCVAPSEEDAARMDAIPSLFERVEAPVEKVPEGSNGANGTNGTAPQSDPASALSPTPQPDAPKGESKRKARTP